MARKRENFRSNGVKPYTHTHTHTHIKPRVRVEERKRAAPACRQEHIQRESGRERERKRARAAVRAKSAVEIAILAQPGRPACSRLRRQRALIKTQLNADCAQRCQNRRCRSRLSSLVLSAAAAAAAQLSLSIVA